MDPRDQFTFVGMPRHDGGGGAVEFGERRIAVVEPQAAAAVVLVGAVAGEAVVRKDRPDIPIEIRSLLGGIRNPGRRDGAPRRDKYGPEHSNLEG